jgi:hypothetical protein
MKKASTRTMRPAEKLRDRQLSVGLNLGDRSSGGVLQCWAMLAASMLMPVPRSSRRRATGVLDHRRQRAFVCGKHADLDGLLGGVLQLIGHQQVADRGHIRATQFQSLTDTGFQLRVPWSFSVMLHSIATHTPV